MQYRSRSRTLGGRISRLAGELLEDRSLLTALSMTSAPDGNWPTVHAAAPVASSLLIGGPSVISSRLLFYNNSWFDGNDPAANSGDDGAIAADKSAYLSDTGPATFANMSSYSRGINGIMIDLAGTHGDITLSDFSFHIGNSNSPGQWQAAPDPESITIRAGQGVGGSDRIEILWADGAIKNTWLEIVVVANADTGLAIDDRFYFASAVADSGDGDTTTALTDLVDETKAHDFPVGRLSDISVTAPTDYNRDGKVDAVDQALARFNALTEIDPPIFIDLSTFVVTEGGPQADTESEPLSVLLLDPRKPR